MLPLVARWSMQRHCSQYILKITTIVSSKKVLFFVIIKSFCDRVEICDITASRKRYAHVGHSICDCKKKNLG